MGNNTKITVSADLSSFSSEIEKMKAQIASLGEQLRTESGKANFNFSGSQKELQGLIAQAEKLTKALDSGDKKSAQYAKNLKAMSTALADAAKVSARLESAGTSSNSNTSQYFRNYATETRTEAADVAIQRERERTQSLIDDEHRARTSRIVNSVSRVGGAIAGSVMGGGGGYANLGAAVGGLMPGPLGLVAGAAGGLIGGLIDKHMAPVRAEMKAYSELTRMIGDATASFSELQGAVRFSTSTFAVSNTEAANLAKNFVALTGVTDKDAIAKAVGSAASMGQQFGMDSSKAGEFIGEAQKNGLAKNSTDINRLILVLAETARKGGVSPQMGAFMDSISTMINRDASRTLAPQSVGSYADLISAGTALPYAGLAHNSAGVASLLNGASEFNANNGGGTGIQELRTRAIYEKYGNDPLIGQHINDIRQAGTGDPSKPFEKGGALWTDASDEGKKDIERLHDMLSGKGTLAEAYSEHANRVAGGRDALRQNIFGQMMGTNGSNGAALNQIYKTPGGFDAMRKQLDGFGIDSETQTKHANRYAELTSGGSAAVEKYYQKLKADKTLHPDLEKEGDKLSGAEKEKFIYTKVVPSQADDEGLNMLKAQVGLDKTIESHLGSLVGIETAAKEALLGILQHFESDNPLLSKLAKQPLDAIGISTSGKDIYDNAATGSQDVADAIVKMRAAPNKAEKTKIADEMIGKIEGARGSGYPMESIQLLKDEAKSDVINQETKPVSSEPAATQADGPGYTGGDYGSRLAAAIAARNPDMSKADIAALVGNFSHETDGFKVFHDPNSGDKPGHDTLGVIGIAHWRASRNKAFADSLHGRDPSDINANADYLTKELNSKYSRTRDNLMSKGSVTDKTIAFERGFEGSGSAGDRSRIQRANDFYNDQLPENHKNTQQAQRDVNHNINTSVTVLDTQGRPMSKPVFTTYSTKPRQGAAA